MFSRKVATAAALCGFIQISFGLAHSAIYGGGNMTHYADHSKRADGDPFWLVEFSVVDCNGDPSDGLGLVYPMGGNEAAAQPADCTDVYNDGTVNYQNTFISARLTNQYINEPDREPPFNIVLFDQTGCPKPENFDSTYSDCTSITGKCCLAPGPGKYWNSLVVTDYADTVCTNTMCNA